MQSPRRGCGRVDQTHRLYMRQEDLLERWRKGHDDGHDGGQDSVDGAQVGQWQAVGGLGGLLLHREHQAKELHKDLGEREQEMRL